MSGWQPIETAPKDGEPILLTTGSPIKSYDLAGYVPFKEIGVIIGWWCGTHWESCFGETHDSGCPTCGSWFEYPLVRPTHWMRLPSATHLAGEVSA